MVRFNSLNHLAVQVHDSDKQGGIWKPVTVTYDEPSGKTKPAFVQRLERQGVRALSSYVGNNAKAQKLIDAGFNLCIPWAYLLGDATARKVEKGRDFVTESDISTKTLNRLRDEAKRAKKHNLISLPNIWFHKDTLPFLVENEYRKCVSVYGKRTNITPCPVDEGVWDRLWLPQMKIIANIQKEINCDGGICLDLEYYVGDFAGGFCYDETAVQGCYCDRCFGVFLSSRDDEHELQDFSLSQRSEYIKKQYSLTTYLGFQELEVARKVRSVCQEVRKIKPDIIMGMLPGVSGSRFQGIENWFTRGAARGMSTPQLPVLLLSETEYHNGFNFRTTSQLDWLKEQEVPGFLVGGLMIGLFTGQGMGAKAAELTELADGYWLYSGSSLMSNSVRTVAHSEEGKQGAHTIREPAEMYLRALEKATNWLDSGAELDDGKGQGSVPIFTPGSVKNIPTGVSITNKGVKIGFVQKKSSLVINGDFRKPFDSGWKTFDEKPKVVKLHNGKKRALLYDFQKRPGDQGRSSFFQTIQLPPGKYRVKVDVSTEGLAGDCRVGFNVCSYNSPRVLLKDTTNQTDCDWFTLQGDLSVNEQTKINLVLLANGSVGKMWFDNIRIYDISHIRLETNSLNLSADSVPLKLVLPEPPKGANFEWELVNPKTGLGYFGYVSSKTDIRYLTAIYPDAPLGLVLEADFEQSVDEVFIEPGQVTFTDR